MKKLIIILSVLTPLLFVNAQDTPQLTYFNGGNLNFSINASSNFFGGGGGSGISGGIISPLLNNYSTAIFSNPAELTFLKSAHFQFDYKTPIGINDFIENQAIQSATDDYLQDSSMFIYTNENTAYTNVNSANAGQLGGIPAISFAIPLNEDFVMAASFNYSLQFKMNLFLNGLQTNLHTSQDVGGNETTFDLLLNTSITNRMALNLTEISLGFAYNFFNNDKGYLSLGITTSKFTANNFVNLLTKIDGMIVMNNSNEYYFNYPDDNLLDKSKNETNDFYWKINGNFFDSEYGGKFGIYYNPELNRSSSYNFSLVFDYKPKFVMRDKNAVNIGYQPKFMKGRLLGEGEEMLDINLDSINLSKPHLTKETNNYFTNEILLETPSSLTFGIEKAFGKGSLSLNLTKYFGRFFYKFDKYELGKETTFGLKLAANISFDDELEGWGYAAIPFRLIYLDIDGLLFQAFRSVTNYRNPHYRIVFGAILGDKITSGLSKDYEDMLAPALGLPFPYGISLSRQYVIFNNINVGVMVFGLPDLAMKFSIGYGF